MVNTSQHPNSCAKTLTVKNEHQALQTQVLQAKLMEAKEAGSKAEAHNAMLTDQKKKLSSELEEQRKQLREQEQEMSQQKQELVALRSHLAVAQVCVCVCVCVCMCVRAHARASVSVCAHEVSFFFELGALSLSSTRASSFSAKTRRCVKSPTSSRG